MSASVETIGNVGFLLWKNKPLGGACSMQMDTIFRNSLESVSDFSFGEHVASVFDDMLERSVPYYHKIQRMIGEMASDFAEDRTEGPGTEFVASSAELFLDSGAEDGRFSRMVQDMDPYKSQKEMSQHPSRLPLDLVWQPGLPVRLR